MANTNVLFKRGTQANLDALIALNGANGVGVDGSFYLTEDTHRLYVGQGKNIVPVNEGVTTVAKIADLPTTGNQGDFYYATEENVLCVRSGNSWVQINPDTSVTGNSYGVSVENNTATVGNTITSSDTSTVSADFSIKGAGNIKVTSENNTITLDDKGYDLTSEINSGVAKIKLTNKNDETDIDTIGITGSTSNVSVSKNADTGNIEIGVGAVSLSKAGLVNNTDSGFALNLKQKDLEGNEEDAVAASNMTSIDPIIKVGSDPSVSANQSKFIDGTATLNVYSKEDIDDKLKAVNAMTFKGVLGSSDTNLPSTGVAIGDTYKFSDDPSTINENNGTTYKAGDLIIATSTAAGTEADPYEDANGYIPSGKIAWVYIPSGDETVYKYNTQATQGTNQAGIVLRDNVDTSIDNGGINIIGGDVVAITNSTDNGNKTNNITVSHAKLTGDVAPTVTTVTGESQTQGSSKAIPVQTYTVNEYGHVTAISQKEYTVVDTITNIDSVVGNASATTNGATVKTAVTGKAGTDNAGSGEAEVDFTSSSLTITATEKTNDANANVSIDMVWGSF